MLIPTLPCSREGGREGEGERRERERERERVSLIEWLPWVEINEARNEEIRNSQLSR